MKFFPHTFERISGKWDHPITNCLVGVWEFIIIKDKVGKRKNKKEK